MKTLSPAEVAKQLGVGGDKVRTWIESGEMPALNVAATKGKRPRWRVTEEGLAAFVASRQNRLPEPKPMRRRKL
ncbi:MAG: helix-turn-helix domain-containing protein [Patescibacteria group bacterium]|nr:helix-turn-helix domain-containing protein [Patescibacteria group bacterium]